MNMTDKDREEAIKMHDAIANRMPMDEPWLDAWTRELARIRSEARAEALREAEKRVRFETSSNIMLRAMESIKALKKQKDRMYEEIASLRSALAVELENNVRHAEARIREVAAFEQAIAERNRDLAEKTEQVERLREALVKIEMETWAPYEERMKVRAIAREALAALDRLAGDLGGSR